MSLPSSDRDSNFVFQLKNLLTAKWPQLGWKKAGEKRSDKNTHISAVWNNWIRFVQSQFYVGEIRPLKMVQCKCKDRWGRFGGNRGVPIVIRDNSGYTTESPLLNWLRGGNFDTIYWTISILRTQPTRYSIEFKLTLPIQPPPPNSLPALNYRPIDLSAAVAFRFQRRRALMRPVAIPFPRLVMAIFKFRLYPPFRFSPPPFCQFICFIFAGWKFLDNFGALIFRGHLRLIDTQIKGREIEI